jgi:pimeloyl-ACP methyl ester carboxylesterase
MYTRSPLDAWVSDMETVADAAGLDRFALFGFSQGCPVAIAYAVRHPERVSHLILYGGFATGANKRSSVTAAGRERLAAMNTLVKQGWGADNPAFRQIFTSLLMPTATKHQADAFNELQRLSASPECAVRYLETVADLTVRELLSQVANARHACSRRLPGTEQTGPRTGGRNTGRPVRGATWQEPCPAGAGPQCASIVRGTERLPEQPDLAAAMRCRCRLKQ